MAQRRKASDASISEMVCNRRIEMALAFVNTRISREHTNLSSGRLGLDRAMLVACCCFTSSRYVSDVNSRFLGQYCATRGRCLEQKVFSNTSCWWCSVPPHVRLCRMVGRGMFQEGTREKRTNSCSAGLDPMVSIISSKAYHAGSFSSSPPATSTSLSTVFSASN